MAAPDGPEGGYQQGYLWDAAMRAGLAVRNYGFMLDLKPYDNPIHSPPLLPLPFTSRTRIAFPANRQLAPVTDPYFRGFDTRFPDYFREAEWKREFDRYVANGNLPALSLVRLMRDHLGDFTESIDGLTTPEAQVADNDFAVGRLVEAVAHSPYADSTLIIIIEDDAQDGADHVDAHRSVCFFAGPYLKRHAVVSERYSTVNVLATIEDILGLGICRSTMPINGRWPPYSTCSTRTGITGRSSRPPLPQHSPAASSHPIRRRFASSAVPPTGPG